MSRHQSRRRRTYGRRQHELQERRERGDIATFSDENETNLDDGFEARHAQIFGLFTTRLGFAEGRG
ncbi:MAG: hypothetical protein ACRDF7_04570 [Candidatus Limnocylindrales bacterium]